jgi:hypothetical protein
MRHEPFEQCQHGCGTSSAAGSTVSTLTRVGIILKWHVSESVNLIKTVKIVSQDHDLQLVMG